MGGRTRSSQRNPVVRDPRRPGQHGHHGQGGGRDQLGRGGRPGQQHHHHHHHLVGQVDDLAPEWDRVESGIDDLLSLSTTYWEPGLGPRAPRKAAGGLFGWSGACAWGGRERRKSCVDSKGMGTDGGKVYVHLMAGRECKDKICRQTRRRKKSPI